MISPFSKVVHREVAHFTAAEDTYIKLGLGTPWKFVGERTSDLVSCIAASTLGKISPSWFATWILAVGTKLLMASNIPTFPFHLAFSRFSSRFLKINRVDSGGKSLIMALAA